MKLLCVILSVFVLMLSARPCCADRECELQKAAAKGQTKTNTKPEEACSGCSPFFTCGSCIGFIAAKPVIYAINLVAEKQALNYTPYIQPGLKEVALAIWQPPQLG